MMAARYSSAIFPRFSKETFIISNSSFNQPTPNKASARPFVSQSSVDHALACTMGLCRGRIDTEEDSFICFVWPPMYPSATVRSEEHTSELQSLMRTSYAVFCLKKKIKYKPHSPPSLMYSSET